MMPAVPPTISNDGPELFGAASWAPRPAVGPVTAGAAEVLADAVGVGVGVADGVGDGVALGASVVTEMMLL